MEKIECSICENPVSYIAKGIFYCEEHKEDAKNESEADDTKARR